MQPEFPHWFNPNNIVLHMNAGEQHVQACDMLRSGVTCCNEALNMLLCERADTPGYIGIAVCEYCWVEMDWGNSETMTSEQTTAYWREKQREWGVR